MFKWSWNSRHERSEALLFLSPNPCYSNRVTLTVPVCVLYRSLLVVVFSFFSHSPTFICSLPKRSSGAGNQSCRRCEKVWPQQVEVCWAARCHQHFLWWEIPNTPKFSRTPSLSPKHKHRRVSVCTKPASQPARSVLITVKCVIHTFSILYSQHRFAFWFTDKCGTPHVHTWR